MTVARGVEKSALRTPRAAAYAGGIFALLLIGSLVTIHFALPAKPGDNAELVLTSPEREFLLVGLGLIPFAGVAFLWFIGVLRDRIGEREDKFFATVFLGSGLLFVAVLLVAEALCTAMIMSVHPSRGAGVVITPAWWELSRNLTGQLLQAALQMAGVFTTATSTLLLRTGAAPRWLGWTGTVLSVILIVGVFFSAWPGLLFPIWILALSISGLVEIRRSGTAMKIAGRSA
jgi:hypothetical protein